MKNVYDILVNFKKNPYEFYEWNQEDDIKHIKKIPSYKVDDNIMSEIYYNDVLVEKSFLEAIKSKTEIFCNREIKIIPYACILFNDNFSLALIFDETGYVIGKSKLLFDESDDVVESGKKLKNTFIDYNIIKKGTHNLKCTRNENKIINVIDKYLNMIYEDHASEELKYIYFECYDREEKNVDKIYKALKTSLQEMNFDVINKLKSLIKVLKK